jgi:SRSO17 transposase
MDQVRPRLEAFAAEMLGGLARSDQRAKGELYLRGLLVDGKRKSMQPMAARLGVDHSRRPVTTAGPGGHLPTPPPRGRACPAPVAI